MNRWDLIKKQLGKNVRWAVTVTDRKKIWKRRRKIKKRKKDAKAKWPPQRKNSVESSDQKKTEADDQLSNYMNQWIVGTSSKLGKNVRWAVTATDRKKIWKKRGKIKKEKKKNAKTKWPPPGKGQPRHGGSLGRDTFFPVVVVVVSCLSFFFFFSSSSSSSASTFFFFFCLFSLNFVDGRWR